MKQMKVWRETPKWLVFATMVVLAILIYVGIVDPIFAPEFDPQINYLIQLYRVAPLWGVGTFEVDESMVRAFNEPIVRADLCMLLGLVCLLLGIMRSINKLDGKTCYLTALFLLLFSTSSVPVLDMVADIFEPQTIIYIHRVSYFTYPIALFIFFFYIMRPSLYKWIWPLVFLPSAYSIAVWIAYLTVEGQFQIAAWLYTEFAAICFAIFLIVGMFGAAQKSLLWFMRVVSAYWGIWIISNAIMAQVGNRPFIRHGEFENGVVISAVIIVCYLVFTGTKELFTYKSEAKALDDRNAAIIETYKNLEMYMSQIARIKHETRNQFIALKMMSGNGEYQRIDRYLEDILDSYPEPVDLIPCGNRLIQSILGHNAGRARQMGFEISFDIATLPPLSISDADVVSLMMNVLNNALESCEKVHPSEKRWIAVSLEHRGSYLHISVKNALGGELKQHGNKYASTKKEKVFHGHGLKIIQGIAEKYGGFADFEHTEDSFHARVALSVVAIE